MTATPPQFRGFEPREITERPSRVKLLSIVCAGLAVVVLGLLVWPRQDEPQSIAFAANHDAVHLVETALQELGADPMLYIDLQRLVVQSVMDGQAAEYIDATLDWNYSSGSISIPNALQASDVDVNTQLLLQTMLGSIDS